MTKKRIAFLIGFISFIISGVINLLSGNTLVAVVFFLISALFLIKIISGK